MTTPAEPSNPGAFPWKTLIVAVSVLLLLGLALLLMAQLVRGTSDTIQQAASIAARFRTGTITTTFRSSMASIASNQGDVLEVATGRFDERLRREDELSVFGGWVYLGTTVSEIRTPVTYRYHIRLSDPWKLAANGNVCVVLAPPLRPSLPPAIHSDGLEEQTESGWARFNKQENLEKLKRELTAELERRASDPRHMQHFREHARKSIAQFVKAWLLREEHWRSDRFAAIVVLFPDEAAAQSESDLEQHSTGATLMIDR